jgi:hypothetical protein
VRTGTRRRRTRSNVVRRVVGSIGHRCHTNVLARSVGGPKVVRARVAARVDCLKKKQA